MKFFPILFVSLLCLFTAPVIRAQVEIDVLQMKISMPNSSGPIRFDLIAADTAGNPVNYIVYDSGIFGSYPPCRGCDPCSAPKVLVTNTFPNPISTALNSHSLIFIKFYLSSNESSPIYLSSRMFSRKSAFVISGRIRLQGKLEIVNYRYPGGGLLYFDNSVDLEGTYASAFGKPILSATGKKFTSFKGIVYDLVKAP